MAIARDSESESTDISAFFSLYCSLRAIAGRAWAGASCAAAKTRWLLRWVAPSLLMLLLGQTTPATNPSFQGVAAPINTGSVTLNLPSGMAIDAAGSLYIADTFHNQIVKVDAQGVASVIPISVPGGSFNFPTAVALDGSGTLYIADTQGNRALRVPVAGGTATVVNTGGITVGAPYGIAMDASGNLFISDTVGGHIVEVPAGGTAAVLNITALGTPLDTPMGLTTDAAGNLYIADNGNSRVVVVAAGGTAGSVLSISGLGTALNDPRGVAVDGSGNIFIADAGNNRIVQVTSSGAGSAVVTNSLTLNGPQGVAVDAFGRLYASDTNNNRAVTVAAAAVGFGHLSMGTSSGKTLTLPFTIGSTTLGTVQALTLGAQGLDFTVASGTTCTTGISSTSCVVNVKYLPTGPGLRRGAVVLYDNGSPQSPMLTVPLYAFSDAPLAALSPNTASVVDTGGVAINFPFQLAFDGAGNIYCTNYLGNNVVKVAAGGGIASVVDTGGEVVGNVTGVAVDGAGNLFIGDSANSRVVVVTPGGVASVLTINGLGTAVGEPTELSFDASGNLYLADFDNSRIVKVTSLVVAGSSSAGNGTVIGTGSFTLGGASVTGVAVDTAGTVYITDRFSNRVIRVTAAGAASELAPSNITFNDPQGVGTDAMGNVYVADSGNNQIVQVTTAGIASVVLAPGLPAPTTLSDPFGVSVDPSGNIYIPDSLNDRIVKVDVSGASLSFPDTNVGSTSGASTATVTNLGNQPLVFANDPSYTAIFARNSGDTNLCAAGAPLAAGNVCDVSVTFAPQAGGNVSANIVVTDNQLNNVSATQSIAVNGNGIVVAVTPTIQWASPAAIAYGTNLSGVLNASAVDGSTSVAGSFAYTATPQGGSASTVTGATVLGVGSYTLDVAFTPNDSTHYNSASGSVTLTVGKATPAIVLSSSATTVPLNTAVTFTAAVSFSTGTPSGSVNFYNGARLLGAGTLTQGVASYATSSLSAGTHSITASYGGDGSFLTVTSAALTETVGKIASTVALTASANAVIVTAPVTFTATVGSASGTPSGSVNFYDGTALLGSGAVAQGVATFTTANLAAGAHSITAVYGGDSTFGPATSSVVTVTVDDFTLSVSTGMSMVSPGETASYALRVNPSGSSTLPAAVTLTVGGLPTGATSTITPSMLAAGAGAASIALAVQVPNQMASSLRHGELLALQLSPIVVGMLLLPFGRKIRLAGRKSGRMTALMALALLLLPLAGLAGCASHSTTPVSTQQKSYTLTVTGTSGTVSHTATLTLIVR
jgi:sugar lactone lactonase YvrE